MVLTSYCKATGEDFFTALFLNNFSIFLGEDKSKVSGRRQEKGNWKIKGGEQRKVVGGNGKLRDRGRAEKGEEETGEWKKRTESCGKGG